MKSKVKGKGIALSLRGEERPEDGEKMEGKTIAEETRGRKTDEGMDASFPSIVQETERERARAFPQVVGPKNDPLSFPSISSFLLNNLVSCFE